MRSGEYAAHQSDPKLLTSMALLNNADHSVRLRHRLFWIGTFGITCLILWLPFGFGLTAVLEEWGVLSVFTTHGTFFFAGLDSPLAAHRLRPLTIFPHALAYALSPDSFDVWNLLLIAALLGKGIGAALLGERATGSRRWGLIFGVLVLLHPADTMQFSFRSLHINLSLALVLLGSALLVRLEADGRWLRELAIATAASIMLLVAVLMYEAATPLVLTPFLVWFVREGLRGSWERVRALCASVLVWLAGIALYLAYVVVSTRSGEATYQQSLTTGHSIAALLLAAIPRLFDPGLVRSVLGGWIDAGRMVHREFAGPFYLVLAATLIGLCVLSGAPPERRGHDRDAPPFARPGLLLRLMFVGVVLVLLGYGPYAISPPHVAITQRTYLFAAPGAAFVVLALLLALRHFSGALTAALVTVLLVCGVAAQWVQFRHYVTISEQQRRVLKTIVENFDGNLEGRTLVVKDLSGQLGHLWMLRDHLGFALTYLYGKPIGPVEICLTPGLEWQRLDDLARPGRCVEQRDGWIFSIAPPVSGPGRPPQAPAPDIVLPAARAKVIEIGPDGRIALDPALDGYRASLATGTEPVDRRYQHILARDYGGFKQDLFKSSSPQEFHWNFGDWWNLDLPLRGSGWRDAEWNGRLLHRHASAWKAEDSASLIFELEPAARSYLLAGHFEVVLDAQIKDSVVFEINGHRLSLVWPQGNGFAALVPPQFIVRGTNTLRVRSATKPDYFGLSISLRDIALVPR